jgi:hypothetical protein
MNSSSGFTLRKERQISLLHAWRTNIAEILVTALTKGKCSMTQMTLRNPNINKSVLIDLAYVKGIVYLVRRNNHNLGRLKFFRCQVGSGVRGFLVGPLARVIS